MPRLQRYSPCAEESVSERVLKELLQKRVACRRGRRNPSGVRKVNFGKQFLLLSDDYWFNDTESVALI